MERSQSSQNKTENTHDCQDTGSEFLDIIDKYQDAIFRFLYFRVNNRSIAVDLTQDTFAKTWVYLNSGKKIEYKEAFLYRSAKNALIDYYKKEKTDSLDILIENGFDPSYTKDSEEILRKDDIESLRTILDTLDEESKQIIFLRYSEEKSIDEIAKIFNKNTNAMTVKIHRIIKKLRDHQNGK